MAKAFMVAAIDFKKAFDMVEHAAIWESLEAQGVPIQYITTLKAMYDEQWGIVVKNNESRKFKISRGTKQGDPISPPIFNAVLETAMSKLRCRWA